MPRRQVKVAMRQSRGEIDVGGERQERRTSPARRWHSISLALLGVAILPLALQPQWVEAPGQGWADLTVYHLDTRENFEFNGEVEDFFADGHAISTSLFFTLAAGLLPGVDGWLQVPYQRREYKHASTAQLSGLSTPGPRSDPPRPKAAQPTSASWTTSQPKGGACTNTLGGTAFGGRSQRDFADEGFFLAQAGSNYGALGLQLLVEGMTSVTTPVIEGILLPNAERSMLQVTPKISYGVGPGVISLGARVPLGGKNLPGGTSVVVGYFTNWSL